MSSSRTAESKKGEEVPPPLAPTTNSTTTDSANRDAETKSPADSESSASSGFHFFSDDHPRHIGAGVRNGLVDACKGVVYGGVSLIAASVSGIHQSIVQRDPVPGVKGIAVGAIGFVGLSLAGVYNGAVQVVQGAAHTKEAMEATWDGNQFWDDRVNQWVTLNLDKENETLPASDDDVFGAARLAFLKKEQHRRAERDQKQQQQEQSGSGDAAGAASAQTRSATSVEDPMEYYSVLGLKKNVSPSDLKKTFAKKALESHPDKNPNDPNASARFQSINEAYRVLSNPVLRQQYDQTGTSPFRADTPPSSSSAASSSSHVMSTSYADSNPMEDAIAGGAVLRPWIGRLRYLLYFHPTLLFSSALMKTYTQRKQLRAALYLRRLLDADDRQWLEYQTTTLTDMVRVDQGAEVVLVLAKSFETIVAQFESNHVLTREVVRVATSVWNSAQYAGLVAMEAIHSGTKVFKKAFQPTDLQQLIFTACIGDIETTAEQAATFVIIDASLTTHEARAQRLKRLKEVAQVMRAMATEVLDSKRTAAAAAAVAEEQQRGGASTTASAEPPASS